MSRLLKVFNILRRRRFAKVALLHHVAASVEHLVPIHICAPRTLLDAGANKGQFALAFRTLQPRALIFAFEPMPQAADIFDRIFAGDESTTLQRVALARADGKAMFHVTDRTDSSSLLKPGTGQERAFGVRVANAIEVPLRRLDDCVDIADLPRPIFLKVDVQGAELGVFEGCDQLGEIDFIYVELSFVELYEEQPLFNDVVSYLAGRGFRVIGVFNQVTTTEFGPTQVDVLFKRGGY